MMNCFQDYYGPIGVQIRKVTQMIIDRQEIAWSGASMIAISQAIKTFFSTSIFGISTTVLSIIIITFVFDTWFGTKASIMRSKLAKSDREKYEENTPEWRKENRIFLKYRYDPKKRQYLTFKIVTLVAYLFMADRFVHEFGDDWFEQVLGATSNVIVLLPAFLFWYKDFKSIGRHIEYLKGKKPPIFGIVESIFELRIKKWTTNESN